MITSKKDLDFHLDALGTYHGSIPRNEVNQLKKGHYDYDSHVMTFSKYDFVTEPAVSEEAMVEYFSWHPAVISKYSNDKLRRKILVSTCAFV
ncbi:unnamed protein product [Bathycoccus prasinos]